MSGVRAVPRQDISRIRPIGAAQLLNEDATRPYPLSEKHTRRQTAASGRSDEILVRRCAKGDEDAFQELFYRYRRRIFSFILHYVGDYSCAEDIFQEVFLRLFKNAARYKPGSAFSTWLYQIARNACIDELRRRGVRARAVQTVRQQGERRRDDWGQPGIAAANEERNRLLSQAVAKLDDKHREVIVLFFYNKLRYREIGEIVGCPEGTARSRVFYGLRELRRILPHETFRDYPGRSEQ